MDDLLEKFKAFAYPGKGNLLGSVAFRPADSELTRTLEVAKALVLRMLGKSVTTLDLTDVLLEEAVFFVAKYFLQNRQFYDLNREIDVNVITEREIQKYETELSGAVYRHVIGLISHARNPSDFIPQLG